MRLNDFLGLETYNRYRVLVDEDEPESDDEIPIGTLDIEDIDERDVKATRRRSWFSFRKGRSQLTLVPRIQ